jgi:hypothetical protein
MRVYSKNKAFWEQEGADVADSILDEDIDLVHIQGYKDDDIDGFFNGCMEIKEGNALQNVRDLLDMRYAIFKEVPLVVTGNAVRLLVPFLGHVIEDNYVNASILDINSYGTGLGTVEEKRLSDAYGSLVYRMDSSFAMRKSFVAAINAFPIMETTLNRKVAVVRVPDIKTLLYQPCFEEEKEDSKQRQLFLELVDLVCIKS